RIADSLPQPPPVEAVVGMRLRAGLAVGRPRDVRIPGSEDHMVGVAERVVLVVTVIAESTPSGNRPYRIFEEERRTNFDWHANNDRTVMAAQAIQISQNKLDDAFGAMFERFHAGNHAVLAVVLGRIELGDSAEAHVRHVLKSVRAIGDLVGRDVGADTLGEIVRGEAQKRAVAAAVIKDLAVRVTPDQHHALAEAGAMAPSDDARLTVELLLRVMAVGNTTHGKSRSIPAHAAPRKFATRWAQCFDRFRCCASP